MSTGVRRTVAFRATGSSRRTVTPIGYVLRATVARATIPSGDTAIGSMHIGSAPGPTAVSSTVRFRPTCRPAVVTTSTGIRPTSWATVITTTVPLASTCSLHTVTRKRARSLSSGDPRAPLVH